MKTARIAFLVCASTLLLLAGPVKAVEERTHDGFFLRLSLGGGGLNMKREGSVTSGASSSFTGSSSISGGAGMAEISMGGTIGQRLVLSGSLVSHQLADPVLDRDGDSDFNLEGPLRFVLVGPSLEYFPDPRGGFHFGGMLALAAAWAKAPEPGFAENLGGVGGAMSLSAGYVWWLGKQWSLGIMARLTGARLHGEHSEQGATGSEDDNVGAFSLQVSALYH